MPTTRRAGGTTEGCSIVIPSRGEGAFLLEAIANARRAAAGAEVVVVASGESAATRRAALARGVRWIAAPRPGRGRQLAIGARAARGAHLVFLHADTRLPDGTVDLVRRALAEEGVVGGAFRLRFDRRHPVLDVLSALTRGAATISFLGDQAMFCTRRAYEAAGGFDEIPLFEDVALARRLAARGRLVRIPTPVVTSARRFERRGILRQAALNLALLARHVVLGTGAEELARAYAAEPPARRFTARPRPMRAGR